MFLWAVYYSYYTLCGMSREFSKIYQYQLWNMESWTKWNASWELSNCAYYGNHEFLLMVNENFLHHFSRLGVEKEGISQWQFYCKTIQFHVNKYFQCTVGIRHPQFIKSWFASPAIVEWIVTSVAFWRNICLLHRSEH